jgi:hypothetical protein
MVLAFRVSLLPFTDTSFPGLFWLSKSAKESDFTGYLCFIASLAMIPLIIYLPYSGRVRVLGLGVWGFWVLWFFAFPVY